MLIYPDLHKYTMLAGIILKFRFLCGPLKSWVHPAHMEIFLETLSMETGHSLFLVCTNPISSFINPNHLCSHGRLFWNSFPRSLLISQHTEKTQSSCTEPILIYIPPSSLLSCTGWHIASGIKLTLKISFWPLEGLCCFQSWPCVLSLEVPWNKNPLSTREGWNLTQGVWEPHGQHWISSWSSGEVLFYVLNQY